MTHPSRSVPFLLVAILCLSGCGQKEAEPTKPLSPYEAKLAALPADAAMAFTFEGEAVMGDAVIGTTKLGASFDAGTWTVTSELTAMGGTMTYEETAKYDAHLAPLEGSLKEKGPEGQKFFSWTYADGTVNLTNHLTENADEKETVIEHEGPFQSSFVTLLLFCRLTGNEAGTYETDVLVTDESKFVSASMTAGASGTWAEKDAKIVKAQRADDKSLEAGFDAATGEFLGAKFAEGSDLRFEIRKADPNAPKAGGPKETDEYYDKPAKSAQQAAAQAALAFAVADFGIIERVTHWPTVAAAHSEAHPEAPMDADAYKGLMMGTFRGMLKPQAPREMIAPMLKGLAASFKLSESEAGTVVEFGPMFRNLKIMVAEVDGTWHLVRFPDAPDPPK